MGKDPPEPLSYQPGVLSAGTDSAGSQVPPPPRWSASIGYAVGSAAPSEIMNRNERAGRELTAGLQAPRATPGPRAPAATRPARLAAGHSRAQRAKDRESRPSTWPQPQQHLKAIKKVNDNISSEDLEIDARQLRDLVVEQARHLPQDPKLALAVLRRLAEKVGLPIS